MLAQKKEPAEITAGSLHSRIADVSSLLNHEQPLTAPQFRHL